MKTSPSPAPQWLSGRPDSPEIIRLPSSRLIDCRRYLAAASGRVAASPLPPDRQPVQVASIRLARQALTTDTCDDWSLAEWRRRILEIDSALSTLAMWEGAWIANRRPAHHD